MADTHGDKERAPRPLWKERALIVIFSPMLILLALTLAICDAVYEGWWEFRDDMREMYADIARRWRGQ